MKINLKVTQKDIDNGQRNTSDSCPIALALLRRGYSDVDVDRDYIYFCCQNIPYTTRALPKEMNSFIMDFDEGREVQLSEFKFEIDEVNLEDWYTD